MIAYLYLHIQTRALERMLRCPEERSSFPGRQENIEPEHFAKRSETHPGEHECFFFGRALTVKALVCLKVSAIIVWANLNLKRLLCRM